MAIVDDIIKYPHLQSALSITDGSTLTINVNGSDYTTSGLGGDYDNYTDFLINVQIAVNVAINATGNTLSFYYDSSDCRTHIVRVTGSNEYYIKHSSSDDVLDALGFNIDTDSASSVNGVLISPLANNFTWNPARLGIFLFDNNINNIINQSYDGAFTQSRLPTMYGRHIHTFRHLARDKIFSARGSFEKFALNATGEITLILPPLETEFESKFSLIDISGNNVRIERAGWQDCLNDYYLFNTSSTRAGRFAKITDSQYYTSGWTQLTLDTADFTTGDECYIIRVRVGRLDPADFTIFGDKMNTQRELYEKTINLICGESTRA